MAAGVQVIDLAIQHVREPGQRVPVVGVERSDRPGGPRGGQAVSDMPVLGDVVFVVEVDELWVDRLAENGDHGQHQEAADGQQAGRSADLSCRARGRRFTGSGGRLLQAFRMVRLRGRCFLGLRPIGSSWSTANYSTGTIAEYTTSGALWRPEIVRGRSRGGADVRHEQKSRQRQMPDVGLTAFFPGYADAPSKNRLCSRTAPTSLNNTSLARVRLRPPHTSGSRIGRHLHRLAEILSAGCTTRSSTPIFR